MLLKLFANMRYVSVISHAFNGNNAIGKETIMRKYMRLFAITFLGVLATGAVQAQLPPFGTTSLLPVNPTSADSLKLSMRDRTCGGNNPYTGNAYRVSMSQNSLTVTLGEIRGGIVPVCPVAPREEIDLGRLPAGSYTLSVVNSNFGGSPEGIIIDKAPFTVTDARTTKVAPYVRLDYSGHWWDPADSGWGLFIWHDARDNVLAAWFTYTPDGKPMWYVFQPTWSTSSATVTTELRQTSRLPGQTSPPPGPTSYAVAGSASLDFTNFGTADEGKLIYTFAGGAQQVRNIQRFKP